MNKVLHNKLYKFEKVHMNVLYTSISALIELRIMENEKYREDSNLSNQFCGNKQARIPFEKYLKRLGSLPIFESNSLILALIYLDRLCDINGLILKIENIHRLFLISLLTAIKYNEDVHISNLFFSKIGGIPLQSLNLLETVFLEKIEYSLHVSDCLFNSYFQKLMKFK